MTRHRKQDLPPSCDPLAASWRGADKILAVLATAAVALAAFLRFFNLESRPFHHDESMFAYYSFNYAQGLLYKYDPLLHGPFMFHWTAALFKLFGDSDLVARLSSGIFALGIFCFPLIFRRQFGGKARWVFWLAASFSPLLLYYSRFFRCDAYALFFNFGCLLAFFSYLNERRERDLWISSGLLALAFCTKENAYPHLFLFLFFLAPYFLWRAARPADQPPPLSRITKIGAPLFFVFLFVVFYSSLFRHWPGVIDGLYRKSVVYWFEQDRLYRILGPFHYHVELYLIYEIPLLLAGGATLIHNLRRRAKDLRWAKIAVGGALALATLLTLLDGGSGRLALPVLHLDQAWHLALLLLLAFFSLLVARLHLKLGETRLAFFGYLSLALLGLYSYLGEKIPWLSLYPLLAFILYLAFAEDGQASAFWAPRLSAAPLRRKAAAAAVLILLLSANLANAVRASFFLANTPRERLLDLAYVPQLPEIMEMLDRHAARRLNPTIALQAAPFWPFSWYLRRRQALPLFTAVPPLDFDFLFTEPANMAYLSATERELYQCHEFKLREAWTPDPNYATTSAVLRYFFWREPFSPVGYLPFNLCILKKNWR